MYRYWLRILGDDRWLTQLLLMRTSGISRLQIETKVFSETGSAGYRGILAQRRRWFLACISANVFANLDWQTLTHHTSLWSYRMLTQTVYISDFHALSLGIILIQTVDRHTQYSGLALCLAVLLNWSILLWVGKRKGRSSTLLYPMFLVCMPFFNMLVRTYTLMTVRKRSWGGSRLGSELKRQ